MKRIINTVVMVIEILLSPFTVFSAICLRTIRKHYGGLTVSRKILQKLKVIPVIDHYYEPLFSKSQLLYPLDSKRTLPGIELNIEKQLAMIGKFDYYDEL
ncbi:MAG: hypothetical protein IJD14_05930, partial [Christensenellaceae bacterium]|nr:hypothetical protein [Christensenellaceae bacterium]